MKNKKIQIMKKNFPKLWTMISAESGNLRIVQRNNFTEEWIK